MLKTTIRLEMISKFVMTFAAIVYSYNLINMNTKKIYSKLSGIILLMIGIYWMFNRDYYLPFLGKCAMPPSLIKEVPMVNVDTKIPVKLTKLPPNTQIMYWASLPGETIDEPLKAYGNYKNSGITMSNNLGEAFARIDCPSNYSVGLMKFKLTKHVHYRYALPEYPGIYSAVYTANVEC